MVDTAHRTFHEAWLLGREHLTAAGVGEAPLEAEVLLRHAAGLTRTGLFMRWNDAVSLAAWASYRDLLEQRARGRPTAYIIGRREFMGLEFAVDERVLIPRQETEILVEAVLPLLRDMDQPFAADVGTGSGAIAIALAHHHRVARVVATDLSEAALEVARRNARRHGVADRTTFLQGNLLEPLSAAVTGPCLGVIASNPPYVPTREASWMPPSLQLYEPLMAFDGGADGLRFHRQIIAGAPALLRPGGTLALEVMAGQADKVAALMEAAGTYGEVRTAADYLGIERVVLARVPA